MRRSTPGDSALPFGLAAVATYAILRFAYAWLPPISWYVPIQLAVLAVAEVWISRRIRAAVRHRPGAKPMTAIAIARSVALAKASVLVGAGLAGAAAGLVLHVLPDVGRIAAARHDLTVGLAMLAASAFVALAGYALERAAIDPSQRGPHADL